MRHKNDHPLKPVPCTTGWRLGWNTVRFQGRTQSTFLGYSMKRLAVTLGSAILGLVVCFAFIGIYQGTGTVIQFPSPGGEDDFSLRAAWFLFGVSPSFLLLGAWIGYGSAGSARTWMVMWVGVIVGGIVVFVVTQFLRGQIESLVERRSANYAVIAFFSLWVTCAIGGALIARSLIVHKPPHKPS